MADFQTHLNAGILVSGAATVGLHGLGFGAPGQALTLFALGVTGSLLPDIDADASAPVRATFAVLGAVLAFAWTLPVMGRFLPLESALIWCGLFLAVRSLLQMAFARFTVHRGIWHSWLGIAFATLATVDLAYWLLRESARGAWVAGGMVGLGYFTHLCLDELYSVDLIGTRVSRSFGTALKPFSLSDPLSSLSMAAAVGALAWLAPTTNIVQIHGATGLAAWAGQILARLAEWSDSGVRAMRPLFQ
jgi:hypothetical protein